jgi:hypothetical protein
MSELHSRAWQRLSRPLLVLALESWRHLAHEAVHFLRDFLICAGLAPDETRFGSLRAVRRRTGAKTMLCLHFDSSANSPHSADVVKFLCRSVS